MTTITAEIDDRTAAQTLFRVLQVLGSEFESTAIPLHQVTVLLSVALGENKPEGLEVQDVQEATGLSSASTSRNLAALGDWHRLQRPGLKLVELTPRLTDRRRKRVRLTDDGQRLIAKLRQTFEEELGIEREGN